MKAMTIDCKELLGEQQVNELGSFDVAAEKADSAIAAPPCDSQDMARKRRNAVTCNNVLANVILPPDNVYYHGYTINVCQEKVMNGRKWKNYDLKEQGKILLRLVFAAVKDVTNKDQYIVLSDTTLEQCPKIPGQNHLHAMILTTDTGLRLFDEYINTRCHTGVGWRTTYAEKCYNAKGWKDYIHKCDWESPNY